MLISLISSPKLKYLLHFGKVAPNVGQREKVKNELKGNQCIKIPNIQHDIQFLSFVKSGTQAGAAEKGKKCFHFQFFYSNIFYGNF